MNTKRLQTLSLILLFLSLLVELSENQSWIVYGKPEFAFGISLGLVLLSLSFNVRIIRTMGVDKKHQRSSQLLILFTAVYAFLVFGIELL